MKKFQNSMLTDYQWANIVDVLEGMENLGSVLELNEEVAFLRRFAAFLEDMAFISTSEQDYINELAKERRESIIQAWKAKKKRRRANEDFA